MHTEENFSQVENNTKWSLPLIQNNVAKSCISMGESAFSGDSGCNKIDEKQLLHRLQLQNEHNKDLEDRISHLQKLNQQLMSAISETTEIEQLKQKYTHEKECLILNHEREIIEKQSQIKELHIRNDLLRANFNQKITELENEKMILDKQINTEREGYQAIIAKNKAENDQMNATLRDYDLARKQNNEILRNVLENKVKELEEELNREKKESSEKMSGLVCESERQLCVLRDIQMNEKTLLLTKITSLESEKKTQQMQMEFNQQLLSELTAKNRIYEEETEKEMSNLRKKVSDLEVQLLSREGNIIQLQSKLDGSNFGAKHSQKSYEEDLRKVNAQKAELIDQLSKLSAEVKRLSYELNEKQLSNDELIKDLKKQLSAEKRKSDALQLAANQLKEEYSKKNSLVVQELLDKEEKLRKLSVHQRAPVQTTNNINNNNTIFNVMNPLSTQNKNLSTTTKSNSEHNQLIIPNIGQTNYTSNPDNECFFLGGTQLNSKATTPTKDTNYCLNLTKQPTILSSKELGFSSFKQSQPSQSGRQTPQTQKLVRMESASKSNYSSCQSTAVKRRDTSNLRERNDRNSSSSYQQNRSISSHRMSICPVSASKSPQSKLIVEVHLSNNRCNSTIKNRSQQEMRELGFPEISQDLEEQHFSLPSERAAQNELHNNKSTNISIQQGQGTQMLHQHQSVSTANTSSVMYLNSNSNINHNYNHVHTVNNSITTNNEYQSHQAAENSSNTGKRNMTFGTQTSEILNNTQNDHFLQKNISFPGSNGNQIQTLLSSIELSNSSQQGILFAELKQVILAYPELSHFSRDIIHAIDCRDYTAAITQLQCVLQQISLPSDADIQQKNLQLKYLENSFNTSQTSNNFSSLQSENYPQLTLMSKNQTIPNSLGITFTSIAQSQYSSVPGQGSFQPVSVTMPLQETTTIHTNQKVQNQDSNITKPIGNTMFSKKNNQNNENSPCGVTSNNGLSSRTTKKTGNQDKFNKTNTPASYGVNQNADKANHMKNNSQSGASSARINHSRNKTDSNVPGGKKSVLNN